MKIKTFLLLLGLFPSVIYASEVLDNLSDCQLAEQMILEISPLINQSAPLLNESDYRVVAQWRVETFHPKVDAIAKKYALSPRDAMNPDRQISLTVYNDFVLGSRLLVHYIQINARDNGNKEDVKLQWETMKQAANVYAAECENSQL
ncbi:hypothetical protein LQK33_000507 [Vibrio vulnificus]|nr:hypothetical protein [Vibrio vulnificus]